ncbi:unnamed protein product [Dibothriocephalus latus]|uniref:Endonuclease/exonuclease/phosphatase domain-containing protein n=1 Tax=Dibothriocephalus latus TaxID=60516 RepID=A0A3P6UPX7_DIBLA|nr:unnamed protein product [Dibothriocephalus latus]
MMPNPDEVKNKFYEDLHALLATVLRSDELTTLGYFNGQITACFHLSLRPKISWMHSRSRKWHLLDFVLVRQRGRRNVRMTKTVPNADGWTDHRLIISKMSIGV